MLFKSDAKGMTMDAKDLQIDALNLAYDELQRIINIQAEQLTNLTKRVEIEAEQKRKLQNAIMSLAIESQVYHPKC